MRVAIVTASYGTAYGGLQTCVARLTAAQTRDGHAVEVLALRERRDRAVADEPAGLTVRRFRYAGRGQFRLSVPLLLELRRRRCGYDVVHVLDAQTPMPLATLVAGAAPVVFTPAYHGPAVAPLARPAHRRLVAAAVGRSAAVVCSSESEERLLVEHVPQARGKTRVVVPGVRPDLRPRPAGGSTGRGRLLSVARQVAYKRTAALVAALPLVPTATCLTVVGDGPAVATMRRLAERLDVADRVEFLGWVGDERLVELYATHDVYVSLSARESLGMAIVDALAAGMRVVASDIPAHREVLTRWGDPSGLVDVDRGVVAVARAVIDAVAATPVVRGELPTWRAYVDAYRDVYARAARAGL